MNTIHIYTDGACSGNPGKGGYGAILTCGNYKKELSGSYRKTTNNRMELMAAIAALGALKSDGCTVVLTSDSKYLVDAFSLNWVEKWVKRSFSGVKNADLWKRLLSLTDKHDVTFKWVKGHSGDVFNERCDELAVNAYTTDATETDEGYENACCAESQLLFGPDNGSILSPEEILTQEFGSEFCARIMSTLSAHNIMLTQNTAKS